MIESLNYFAVESKVKKKDRKFCRQGHIWKDNFYVYKSNDKIKRTCKTCHRITDRKYKEKRKYKANV